MICVKCKKDIPEASAFCNHCGASQSPAPRKAKRGNGQGCVYKRGDKWAAEVTLGYYMQDGKRKRKMRRKCGFARKKDAVAYIETLRNGQPVRDRATLSELYALFADSEMQKLSKSKAQAYSIAWRKIESDVCYRYINELTVPELQQITDTAGTSYYTKRDIKNLLSHLYKLAIRDDYIDKNRAQYIDLPENQSAERTIFEESEIAALWADADQVIVRHMLVMIYTGLRPGELLTIRKENVQLDAHYMTGGIKTKKSRARKIIIPDRIQPILRRMIADAEGDTITNYVKHQFYDAWAAYRDAAGMRSELSPYCCRHTYITRLTALKVSPAMLQELAGHEDYDTTLEYTHLSVTDRLSEVNRLA